MPAGCRFFEPVPNCLGRGRLVDVHNAGRKKPFTWEGLRQTMAKAGQPPVLTAGTRGELEQHFVTAFSRLEI